MATKLAVCSAGFIHIILGLTLYVTQAADSCSPAPQIASYIFAGTILIIAADTPLFSERYTHLPYSVQYVVETMGTLAILEFFNLWVWCSLERLIYYVVRLMSLFLGMGNETYLELEFFLLGVPTTALAIIFYTIVKRSIIPHFKIKSLFIKQQVRVHLNREMYMEMLDQRRIHNN